MKQPLSYILRGLILSLMVLAGGTALTQSDDIIETFAADLETITYTCDDCDDIHSYPYVEDIVLVNISGAMFLIPIEKKAHWISEANAYFVRNAKSLRKIKNKIGKKGMSKFFYVRNTMPSYWTETDKMDIYHSPLLSDRVSHAVAQFQREYKYKIESGRKHRLTKI